MIRCQLFGCRLHDYEPACARCGAHLYDGNFIQRGRLTAILDAWRNFTSAAVRLVVGRHCEVCGKRLPQGKDYLCDDPECWATWLPF